MIACMASRCIPWVTLALTLACLGTADAQDQRRAAPEPLAAGAVHPVVARHGMVVAQEKIAARIGADVLARGSNAVDTTVATGFLTDFGYEVIEAADGIVALDILSQQNDIDLH